MKKAKQGLLALLTLIFTVCLVATSVNLERVEGAATGYTDHAHVWKYTKWTSNSDCSGCKAVAGKTDCTKCIKSNKVPTGLIACTNSSCDSGKIKCSSCSGAKTKVCQGCNGVGYFTYFYKSGGMFNGKYYSSSKKTIGCGGCGGRTDSIQYIYYSDTEGTSTMGASGTYYAGTGQVTCSTCSGVGEVNCATCGGDGRVTCTTCGGDGTMGTTCARCNGDGWNTYCTNSGCKYNKNDNGGTYTPDIVAGACYTTENTYTIAFNGNGNTGGSTASLTGCKYTGNYALTANGFTKTGYYFAGWATSSSGAVAYSNGATVSKLSATNGATVTLYAKWNPNTYTITLNNQSATTAGTTAYYEKYNTGKYTSSACNTSISSITIPRKTGYTFGGYYTGVGGTGTQYINASGFITAGTTTFTSNTTLYAKWIPLEFAICFDANGGVFAPGTASAGNDYYEDYIAYHSDMSINEGCFVDDARNIHVIKTGYLFDGYWDDDDTGEQVYDDGYATICEESFFDVDNLWHYLGDAYLYAHWSPIRYQISYDGNGASSGSMTNSTHTYDANSTLKANAFKREGYDFVGWSTNANATTAMYVDGQSILNLASTNRTVIKLYAVWELSKQKITYDANGGIFSDGKTTQTTELIYGSSVDLTISPTRPGLVFVGWALTPDGTPLDSCTVGKSAMKLYAIYSIPVSGLNKACFSVWKAGDMSTVVSFDMNIAEETVDGYIYALNGLNATVSGLGTNVEGAFFVYDKAGNYKSISFTPSGEDPDPDIVLPNYYNQTTVYKFYNINKDSYDIVYTITESVLEGSSYKPATLPTTNAGIDYKVPDGYYSSVEFSSTAKVNGTTISKDTTYTVTGDETHTFICQPKKYTVTLNANGGHFPDGTTIKTKEVSYTGYYESLPTPRREGHKFLGWYTQQTVSTSGTVNGDIVTATTIYETVGDTTLYAAWEVYSYDILFDYSTNGGISANGNVIEKITVKYGDTINLSTIGAPAAQKTGWKAIGWSQTASAKTTDASFTMPVPSNGKSITVFALYSRTYTYTFKSNGTSKSVQATLYNSETETSITAPNIVAYSGWTSLGWTAETVANGTFSVSEGGVIDLTSESAQTKTYYASCKKDISVKYVVPAECKSIDSVNGALFFNAYGNTTKLTVTLPTPSERPNYSFTGWLSNIGDRYDAGASVSTTTSLVFTAFWDAHPSIITENRYFTLEDAQSGAITMSELLSTASATDAEDGDITDVSKFYVVNFNASEYTSLTGSATFTITYRVIDSYGHVIERNATVYIVDTTVREIDATTSIRFIENKYYATNDATKDADGDGYVDGLGNVKDFGGLVYNSFWKTSALYKSALESALSDRSEKAAIAGMEYSFTREEIEAMKEYTRKNGYSNLDDESGRNNFINKFLRLP